jgi:hypothetical protein
MSATFTFPYRIAAATAEEAIAKAKAQANAEGWTVRTVASARPAPTGGQWIVTLAVYATAEKAPA